MVPLPLTSTPPRLLNAIVESCSLSSHDCANSSLAWILPGSLVLSMRGGCVHCISPDIVLQSFLADHASDDGT